jgi:hypothetical protein
MFFTACIGGGTGHEEWQAAVRVHAAMLRGWATAA